MGLSTHKLKKLGVKTSKIKHNKEQVTIIIKCNNIYNEKINKITFLSMKKFKKNIVAISVLFNGHIKNWRKDTEFFFKPRYEDNYEQCEFFEDLEGRVINLLPDFCSDENNLKNISCEIILDKIEGGKSKIIKVPKYSKLLSKYIYK